MLYSHLPIFKDLYSLSKELLWITQRFHKWYRYTLGEKINTSTLDLLVYIYQAQSNKEEKRTHVMNMRILHEQLVLLIRLSHDLNQLSKEQYAELIPNLEAIGKQLTSWHQKISKSN